MMAIALAVVVSFELNGIGGGWTDVTEHAWAPVQIQRGIRGSSPIDRVAPTGTMRFSLNNAPVVDGAPRVGYYSPGHSDCRGGFAEGIGVKIEGTATLDGSPVTVVLFRGELDVIEPRPGTYEEHTTDCVAVDWMNEAAVRQLSGLDIQLDQRSDEVFSAVVAAMPKQPPAIRVEQGLETFAFALDSTREGKTTPAEEFAKIALSELGQIYAAADGTLTFESRQTRGRASANVQTFDNTMTTLSARRARADLIGRVVAEARPRTLGAVATDVVFAITSKPAIPPNSTQTFFGPFVHPTSHERIGATDIQAMVAGTDYVANTAADGSGTNRTAMVSITVSATASGASFQVVSAAPETVYLTTFQLRGRTMQVELVQATREDADIIATAGAGDLSLPMPYQGDVVTAASAAAYVLGLMKDPLLNVTRFTFFANSTEDQMRAALLREISDRIGIREAATGATDAVSGVASVARGYFINGIDLEIGTNGQLMVSYILTPADQNAYWILGQPGASELGLTTRLSYGLFQGHADVDHGDVAHVDDAHDDTAHVDTAHADAAHGDSNTHQDVAHTDVAHSDRAHNDSAHEDVAHQDSTSHSDVGHQDQAHTDVAHQDEPADPGKGNPHEDVAHQDVAHKDTAHQDGSTHHDVAHTDEAYEDVAHGDTVHSDAAHQDLSHLDTVHQDTAHADTPHDDDPHDDVAHVDVPHGDATT